MTRLKPHLPLLVSLGIVLATLAAYRNTLEAPLVFDDLTAIKENASIRSLGPIAETLLPPQDGGETVEGRPILNLSFAFNYALSKLDVRSYHIFNIVVHALSGLALFGVVRRTLVQPRLAQRFAAASLPLASYTALVWALHPLQTASVTYLSRRAESLAGLFYLLTLYLFIRSLDAPKPKLWLWLSALACFSGAATKEVLASAPLVVFLYDRSFIAGSFRQAWTARRWYYLGLASSWVLLAGLLVYAGNRGGTAGFGTSVSSWQYALTQCEAIARYIGLAFWPDPLVFDYGNGLATSLSQVWPEAILVLALLAATVFAVIRFPAVGFLGVWFFAILAPSSSFIPVVTQTIAEHRMYLPLAAILAGFVIAAFSFFGRPCMPAFLAIACIFGLLSAQRNYDYRSAIAIWADTVEKAPRNARAHNNLGSALSYENRVRDALPHFQDAVRLDPRSASAHANLASALLELGQPAESLPHFEAAAKLKSQSAATIFAHASAFLQTGQKQKGVERLLQATKLDPNHLEARLQLGNLFAQSRRYNQAIAQFAEAARIAPKNEAARNNLGNALLLNGQIKEAKLQYQRAVELDPNSAKAHANLGIACFLQRSYQEAERHLLAALQLDPQYAPARSYLARLRSDR